MKRNIHRDPLLKAGVVTCPTCGNTAYPTDAMWVGAAILATYMAPCEHSSARTWLIDLDPQGSDGRGL